MRLVYSGAKLDQTVNPVSGSWSGAAKLWLEEIKLSTSSKLMNVRGLCQQYYKLCIMLQLISTVQLFSILIFSEWKGPETS